jgi:1-acyl-sn-glycerol-3-phosphate acyltransferase
MKYARATVRLFVVSLATGGFYCLWLFGRLALARLGASRARTWRNWIFRNWARCIVALLRLRVDVFNTPPQSPFVLVANHLSYVDVVLLASRIDCAFVAKSEVAAWPILGGMCRGMNTVFIDRGRKRDLRRAMTDAQKLFEEGLGVVLFAEGTSTAGHAVAPFKSSMLDFAARNNVPVHYATISYSTPTHERPASEAVCWWGEMTFPDHFWRLLQLSGFDATLAFGPTPIVANDRHELASKLWSAVNEQFMPPPLYLHASVNNWSAESTTETQRHRDSQITDCIDLLRQGIDLVHRIDTRVFAATTPISPRGSIGAHFRHILDTYDCFLKGVANNRIDYSLRRRDPLVEQNRTHAIEKMETLVAALSGLASLDPNARLLVSAEEQPSRWFVSSVSREVEFLKSHTIHHYSLIAMLLRLHEIDPGAEFGVAPSTLRHWNEELACAR